MIVATAAVALRGSTADKAEEIPSGSADQLARDGATVTARTAIPTPTASVGDDRGIGGFAGSPLTREAKSRREAQMNRLAILRVSRRGLQLRHRPRAKTR
ncbi:MAG: hypothetical protein WDA25_10015 [Paracoccaceae bacterium]